jgi:hypothetical protein
MFSSQPKTCQETFFQASGEIIINAIYTVNLLRSL